MSFGKHPHRNKHQHRVIVSQEEGRWQVHSWWKMLELIGDFSSSDLYSTAWTPCGRLSILVEDGVIDFSFTSSLFFLKLPVRFDVLLHVVALNEPPARKCYKNCDLTTDWYVEKYFYSWNILPPIKDKVSQIWNFCGENPNVGKINRSGMKMSACSLPMQLSLCTPS